MVNDFTAIKVIAFIYCLYFFKSMNLNLFCLFISVTRFLAD